jgi:hypothetical protein
MRWFLHPIQSYILCLVKYESNVYQLKKLSFVYPIYRYRYIIHYILKFERAKYFKPNILRLVKGIDQEQDEATHPQYRLFIY